MAHWTDDRFIGRLNSARNGPVTGSTTRKSMTVGGQVVVKVYVYGPRGVPSVPLAETWKENGAQAGNGNEWVSVSHRSPFDQTKVNGMAGLMNNTTELVLTPSMTRTRGASRGTFVALFAGLRRSR